MSKNGLVQGGTTRGSGLTQAGLSGQNLRQDFSLYGSIGTGMGAAGQEYGSLLSSGQMGWGDANGETFSPGSINAGVDDMGNYYGADGFSSNDFDTKGLLGAQGSGDFSTSMGNLQGLMNVAGTGFNIYNAYQGNKMRKEMLGFAREEAGRAKDQWNITRNELGRIQQVRKNLNAGYVGGGNYAQLNAANDPEKAKAVSTKLRT